MGLIVMNATELPCKHCGRTGLWKRRGLCRTCHDRPGVRERYGPVRFGFTAEDDRPNDFCGEAPRPEENLPGLPGSEVRKEEMARRAANRQQLFAGGERRPMDDDDYRRLAQRMGPT